MPHQNLKGYMERCIKFEINVFKHTAMKEIQDKLLKDETILDVDYFVNSTTDNKNVLSLKLT